MRFLLPLLLLLALNFPAVAQTGQAELGKRVALVVGNAGYPGSAELYNSGNDAREMAKKLRWLEFDVIETLDADYQGFNEGIEQFLRKIEGADIAVFFYAGHAVQVNKRNYLVPIDVQLENSNTLEENSIAVQKLLTSMQDKSRINLVLLDACRNNPFEWQVAENGAVRSLQSMEGLSAVEMGSGSLIAYSTQPGNVALDGAGEHSPFTEALLKHIGSPGLDFGLIIRRVREEVKASTNGDQLPWTEDLLTGLVVLNNGLNNDVADDIKDPVMAKAVQTELNRVGCNAGTPNGVWGNNSRTALRRYKNYTHLQVNSLGADLKLLQALKSENGMVCPQIAVREQPAQRRPAPAAAPSRSQECFSFDGAMRCF
ncbi:caspase family protein [Labrenzia sp. ac12]